MITTQKQLSLVPKIYLLRLLNDYQGADCLKDQTQMDLKLAYRSQVCSQRPEVSRTVMKGRDRATCREGTMCRESKMWVPLLLHRLSHQVMFHRGQNKGKIPAFLSIIPMPFLMGGTASHPISWILVRQTNLFYGSDFLLVQGCSTSWMHRITSQLVSSILGPMLFFWGGGQEQGSWLASSQWVTETDCPGPLAPTVSSWKCWYLHCLCKADLSP